LFSPLFPVVGPFLLKSVPTYRVPKCCLPLVVLPCGWAGTQAGIALVHGSPALCLLVVADGLLDDRTDRTPLGCGKHSQFRVQLWVDADHWHGSLCSSRGRISTFGRWAGTGHRPYDEEPCKPLYIRYPLTPPH